MKGKKVFVYVLASSMLLIMLVVALIYIQRQTENNYSFIEDIKPEYVNADLADAEDGSIAIPGFKRLVMQAGQSNQSIHLYNPKENICYFVITIELPDGAEIYRSDMLAPGESLSGIKLHTLIDAGIYEDTILRYTCYSVNDLRLMNGASIKLNLEVIP